MIAKLNIPRPTFLSDEIENVPLMNVKFTCPTDKSDKNIKECYLESDNYEGRVLEKFFPNGYLSCGSLVVTLIEDQDVIRSIKELLKVEKRAKPLSIDVNQSLELLDPNDPHDLIKIKAIKEMHSSDSKGKPEDSLMEEVQESLGYFRLDYEMEKYSFSGYERLLQSKRIRLLLLRNSGNPKYRDIAVPLNERDISPERLTNNEESNQKLNYSTSITRIMGGFIENHEKYLTKISNRIRNRFRMLKKSSNFVEIVREEKIPDLMTFFKMVMVWMIPRRPLEAVNEKPQAIAIDNLIKDGFDIIITIRSGSNLPQRRRDYNNSERIGQNQKNRLKDFDGEILYLQPCVEVRFKEFQKVTATSNGCNPTWNTTIRVPVDLRNENIRGLSSLQEPILIALYDEFVTMNSISDTTKIKQTERRWIGCLEIPFSSPYNNSKLDGNFQLKIPEPLVGYEVVNPNKCSSINAMITFDPFLSKSTIASFENDEDQIEFPTLETIKTMTSIKVWLAQYTQLMRKLLKTREIFATVLDTECQEVLITRFLAPVIIPKEFSEEIQNQDNTIDMQRLMRRLARYVSLIPNSSDQFLFSGPKDVWCSCEQFLKMLSGDEEEHIVLFACYLLYLMEQLGEKSEIEEVFLLNGYSYTEGKKLVVLIKPTNNGPLRMWNLKSFTSLSVTDERNNIDEVWMVFNNRNIWANIQLSGKPSQIIWKFEDRKCWMPLFVSQSVQNELEIYSLQNRDIIYLQINQKDLKSLKYDIESILRDYLIEWRSGKVTRMNYEFLEELTITLEKLENFILTNDETNELMKKISERYHVFGFPLNFGYQSIEDICNKVKSLGLHSLIGPNSRVISEQIVKVEPQFCLAVHVAGYSGSVLSIWIYFLSMWKKS